MGHVNAPVLAPTFVVSFATVGVPVVFQQSPDAVKGAPPSVEIFPPPQTEESVIAVMFAVVRSGSVAEVDVVKLISFP
jgi:hypothetical protein